MITTDDAELLIAEELQDPNGVTFSGLDPILGSLGEMVGLLDKQDGTADTYGLNNEWFEDPINNTKAGFTGNSANLGDMLGQILGKVGGNALGIPITDPALLGTWYPVKYDDKETGLYFISYQKDEETVFGVGVLHTWEVPASSPLIKVDVWGMIPFIRVGKNEVNITFNKEGYPITLGVALEGAGKSPLIDVNDVSFNGVKVNAAIDLAAKSPFGINIQVLQLKLPGDPAPMDRTLADLEAITGQQILETASSLFVGALSKVFDDPATQARISYFPPLLGFTSIVPKSTSRLPILKWYDLFDIAANPSKYPQGPATPFLDWFNTLSTNTGQLKTWLSCLGSFLNGEKTDATGSGTRADPFQISIIAINQVGALSFTVGTEVIANGERYFYPGLSFGAAGIQIGSSDIVLNMDANLELAQFQLSGTSIGAEPTINFSFTGQMANKTAGEPLCTFDGYSFGSLEGGLSFGLAGSVIPYFNLTGVVTPSSSFDVINLLSPSQLADAGAALLSDGIKSLLGLASNNAFSNSVASLIGLTPPETDGRKWPEQLPPPFDAKQMIDSITNPLGAWANYYLEILKYPDLIYNDEGKDGKKAFTFVVQAFGTLLNAATGAETIEITGDGTPDRPWKAGISLAEQTLPAFLTSYSVPLANGGTSLVLGLSLEPSLTVAGVLVVPSLTLDVVKVDIPADGNPASADWLPLVAARLTLPDGFTTPDFGGVSFKVDQSQLSGSWSRNDGWEWSLFVNKPTLTIDKNEIKLNKDLNFADQDALDQLLTDGIKDFAPFFTGAIGAFLLRTQTRAGLFTTGALGLLTDLSKSPIFPKDFSWKGFKQLEITSFKDPWPVLRGQMASDLDTPEKAKSMLGLLAWTIDSSLEMPPAINGSGTFEDPYSMPVPFGFEIPLWYDKTTQVVGVGIGRSDVYNYDDGIKFKFSLQTRLNAIEYSLATGEIVNKGNCPGLSFIGTLSNPDGLLINLPLDAGSVEKVLLGFNLNITSSAVNFEPVVTMLGVTLAGQPKRDSLTLDEVLNDEFAAALQASFNTILNAAVQAAINQVKDVEGFKTAYDLLSLMGLTTDWDASAIPNGGINLSGWTGLIADYNGYIRAQLSSLLTDSTSRAKFFAFLENTFGITIPKFPKPLLDLLSALQVCGAADEGYPLLPEALIELVSSPVESLKKRFSALFNDPDTLMALTRELTQSIPPLKYGMFTFGSNSSGVVSLEVKPDDAFKLGTFLDFSGSLQLDLINQRLSLTAQGYCPILGIALSNVVTLSLPLDPDKIYTAELIFGDSKKPSAEPLQLYPFEQEKFLDTLKKVAPAYILNVVSNAVLEDSLLKKYPLVQKIFSALGLASNTAEAEQQLLALGEEMDWSMRSILGILRDPIGWLLSDEVLGINGRFNVAKLAGLLSKLPEVKAPNGILLEPLANGMKISGLPYGFNVGITGVDGVASFAFNTDTIEIAGGKGKLDNLTMRIDLDADYQPAFAGGMDISTNVVGDLFASVGYNKGFEFRISQGTPAKPQGLALQLLPFLGWGNLAGESLSFAAAYMVKNLTPKLLEKLKETGAKEFIERIEVFAGKIEVVELVNKLLDILTYKNFQEKTQAELLKLVETASLDWLKVRFSEAEAPATADAVLALLSGLLPTQLTTQGGLVCYTPSPNIPLVIKAGLNSEKLLGLWTGLTLPKLEIVKIGVSDAGAGINIDTGEVSFSFGVDISVPIEKSAGPGMNLQYVNGEGFVMLFDPVATPGEPSKHSALARQFLPDFFPKRDGEPDELSARMAEWIFEIFKNVIPRYISILVLNLDSVKTWLNTPIIGTDEKAPSPGSILKAASIIIVGEDDVYSLNSIDNLLKLSPTEFFGNFLKELMKNEITLLTFGEDKKSTIKIGPEPNNEGSYGLHLFAPSLKIPAIPNIVIQLGDSENEWITESGGVTGTPGIGLYIPIDTKGTFPSADFSMINLVLNNVGFDMVGKNGKPLVDLKRFSIGAIKPRVLFDLNLNGGKPKVKFGAGVTLQDIGISLAPNTMAPGDSDNPIASNLLGAGSDSDKNKRENEPTNPTFSVTAAYTEKVYVNLKSNTGNGTQVIVPVQRSFGPLYVESLGLGWDDPAKILEFLFSGSVDLAGLKTTLIGLTIGVPTQTPADLTAYRLDLQGIDISFEGGAVAVEAGLFKQTDPFLCYNGTAVIKGGKFSVLALGSYAEMETEDGGKEPSLFIFGVLNMPLGGPPAFFITGIAAGFAYNRGLIIPAIDKVQEFPLVLGLAKGSFTSNDPGDALKQLSDFVPPRIGQYWLAAGIKFKSFGLINTSALLFLSFGRDWELNILGLSYASLPPEISPSLSLAYFELAIKVSFKFTAGIISAEAQLTPNSFVLTRDCRVTGGFAFYLWYKSQKTADYTVSAGDFVITLGGYHPAFAKPVYYPDVPRLGMLWKMSVPVGSVSISGGAYFALCPTAVMAGGYLNVNFEMGPLAAWLDAYANFLIEWNPFYFNVGIGITVGVSFGTTIAGVSVTIRAELGAKLLLEGPPVHGYVQVDWYVISFTIPIGSGENATVDKPLDWELFEKNFLPPPTTDENASKKKSIANSKEEPADEVNQVVKWSAGTGMQSTNANPALWTVTPVPFAVSVQSAIPASQLSVVNSDFNAKGVNVGVRPMNFIDNLDAPLTVTVLDDSGTPVNLKANNIALTTFNNGAPSALWSKEALNREQAPNPDTMLISDALFGLEINANQYVFKSVIPGFDINRLKYDWNDIKLLPFAHTPAYPAAALYPDQRAYTWIRTTIMNAAVAAKRNDVLTALRASSILAPSSPDLSVMAFSPELIFQDLPVVARLGIYQNGGVPEAGIPVNALKTHAPAAVDSTPVTEPKLVGIFKRYVAARNLTANAEIKGPDNNGALQIPGYNRTVRASWTNKIAIIPANLYKIKLNTRQPKAVKLYEGSVGVWKVDATINNSLAHAGGLPVFVLSFDRYHAISGMKMLREQGNYNLPGETAEVVVQGYSAGAGSVTGWQMNTLLSKVNPVWSVGDGVLIRTQNSQRTAVPDTGGQIGLIDMAALLRNNKVRGLNGLQPGWIQSIFPGAAGLIAVLTDNKPDSRHELAVTVAADEVPFKTGLSTPVNTFTRGNKTVTVFKTTAPAGEHNYYGVIARTLGNGLNILGMYSIAHLDSLSENEWARLTLHNGGLDLTEAAQASADITITIA